MSRKNISGLLTMCGKEELVNEIMLQEKEIDELVEYVDELERAIQIPDKIIYEIQAKGIEGMVDKIRHIELIEGGKKYYSEREILEHANKLRANDDG